MSLVDKAAPAIPDTGTTPPAAGDAPPATTPTTPPVEPMIVNNDWYYDKDIKGTGERPEWLKTSKYATAMDQAKAYAEVEKKLGAFKGAPDAYDLTLEGHPDIKFSAEDPMLKDFLDNAKKNGVSQEYVTELLTTYAHAMTANIPDVDAEIAALGPNGKEDINILAQWGNSTFTPEEFGVFKSLLTTAASVRFFEKIRGLTTGSDIAPPGSNITARETEQQVRDAVSDPRYDTDPNFRAEVKRRMAAAIGVGVKK